MDAVTFAYKCKDCGANLWFTELTITDQLEIASDGTCLSCGHKMECYIDLTEVIDELKVKYHHRIGFRIKENVNEEKQEKETTSPKGDGEVNQEKDEEM